MVFINMVTYRSGMGIESPPQASFFFLLLAERSPHATMPSKRQTHSSAQHLVQLLKNPARLAPIPYLQDAAGLALGIVNLIQVSLFGEMCCRQLTKVSTGSKR